MTTNQSVETEYIEFIAAWERTAGNSISASYEEELLKLHRQLVGTLTFINRIMGRDIDISVRQAPP